MAGSGSTYAVHIRLIRKLLVDFLLVVIEFFLLGVTVAVLRTNMDWKLPFLQWVGHFGRKFQVEGTSPTNHLCTVRYACKHIIRLLLKVFTQINFVADFLREQSIFRQIMVTFRS